jgi:cytochrome c oxidase assembly protein subunit 11
MIYFQLVPGETALAFYTAYNPTDVPVTGVSTYNVIPFEAGQYFNKIQCFCFEEQLLNPHEQVRTKELTFVKCMGISGHCGVELLWSLLL